MGGVIYVKFTCLSSESLRQLVGEMARCSSLHSFTLALCRHKSSFYRLIVITLGLSGEKHKISKFNAVT